MNYMKNWFNLVITTITVFSIIGLCACGEDEPKSQQANGVHKITIELSGSEEYVYAIDFAGNSSMGKSVKLYNGDGDYQGENYLVQGKLVRKQKIICYTQDNASLLVSALAFSSAKNNESITYSLKAYIDNDLVDELSGTFTSKDGLTTRSLTLSTGKK